MKMKKFFFGVFGLLALASCTNDELVSVNRDGDEITFSVVTNAPSRAAAVYCNNNPLDANGFSVWAWHNNQLYIDGDQITRSGTVAPYSWVNASDKQRYWPEGEVSFFASKHEGVTETNQLKWNNGQPSVIFTVDGSTNSQKDFVYAVNKQSKYSDAVNKTLSGPVKLNFRHALSQIVFKAKNTNAKLYVDIEGVKVCNVYSKGSFTFPSVDTEGNYSLHSTSASSTSGFGTWSINPNAEGQTQIDYSVTFDKKPLEGSAVVNMTANTNADDPASNDVSKVLLLLPKDDDPATDDLQPWDKTDKPDDQNGTYFLVNCRIFNIAGTSFQESKDVCLWGTKAEGATTYTSKEIAIPFTLDWEQGKRYVYTFVFGQGNGGYDPSTDTPEPVLVPIKFEVSVDDFIPYEDPNDTDTTPDDIPVVMDK